MAGLRSAIEGYVLAGLDNIANWPATSARLRCEHRDILAAVTRGDAAAARLVVHTHISGYYAESHLTSSDFPTPHVN